MLIHTFEAVRDIPYYIATGDEPDFCCFSKAEILLRRFRELGLQARSVLTRFRWEDLPLPEELLRLEHVELEHHRHVEVFLPAVGRYVQVDPTWDAPLKAVFPLAEWDGQADTQIAVPVLRTYSPEDGELEYARITAAAEQHSYLGKMHSFLAAFNCFVTGVRETGR